MTTVTHRAPRQIMAGDSIEFLVAVPADYQAWTGSARLVGPSQMNATSVVTEGADFHVKFEGQSAAGTKTLGAGQYTLTVWATLGNDRKAIAEFRLTIAPDRSAGTPALAFAIEMLPIVEAELRSRMTGDGSGLESYAIDGTSVTKMTLQDLRRWRSSLAAEVAQIQNPNGQIGRVKFVMSPTGGMVDVRRRFGP